MKVWNAETGAEVSSFVGVRWGWWVEGGVLGGFRKGYVFEEGCQRLVGI